MNQPLSKTKQAVDAFKSGDVKGALKLVSTFRIGFTKEEQATFKRGFESMHSPRMYAQLGKDPAELQRLAVALFSAKYADELSAGGNKLQSIAQTV